MADLEEGHPGCLVAIYCYNDRMFDNEIHALNLQAVQAWRARFLTTFKEIAAIYPPKDNVDLEALADMLSTTVEGGIVMSKALRDPKVLADQILLFRSYIKLLFVPSTH